MYSISQEICTRFLLCCALLWLYIDWFSHIHHTSLALWQSNDCPSASKATLMNMDKYFMWIHYERLNNHNNTKHNKTVCIFLRIYCIMESILWYHLQLWAPFMGSSKTAQLVQMYITWGRTHFGNYQHSSYNLDLKFVLWLCILYRLLFNYDLLFRVCIPLCWANHE